MINDLYLSRTVSFIDTLCGFSYEVIHFNKKKLTITIKPGLIKEKTYTQCIHKMGMPIDDTELYGNLYIEYTVNYPDSITSKQISELRKLFPEDSKQLSINLLTVSSKKSI